MRREEKGEGEKGESREELGMEGVRGKIGDVTEKEEKEKVPTTKCYESCFGGKGRQLRGREREERELWDKKGKGR